MSILGPNKNKRYTGAHQSLAFSRRMLLVGGAQAAVGALLVGRQAISRSPRTNIINCSARATASS